MRGESARGKCERKVRGESRGESRRGKSEGKVGRRGKGSGLIVFSGTIGYDPQRFRDKRVCLVGEVCHVFFFERKTPKRDLTRMALSSP